MSRSRPTSDRNAHDDGDSPLGTASVWIIGNEGGFETCASSSFDLNDNLFPLPSQQHAAVAQKPKQGSHSIKRSFSSPPEDCESSFPSFSNDATVSPPRNKKRQGLGKRPLDSRSVFLREERARILQNSPSIVNTNKNLVGNHPPEKKHQLLQQQNIIFANNGQQQQQQQSYNMHSNDVQILQQHQQQGNSAVFVEQVRPQWLWHRTCDSIEIPPSHFVTITDSNGVPRRYKRFYAAVSMPYELASTYDAMSLYTAARSAFDSAMVRNNCPHATDNI